MRSRRYNVWIFPLIMTVIVLSVIPILQNSLADNINPSAYPPDSKPFGLTPAQWTAKWWQWLLQIPTEINPAADKTGEHCAVGQPAKDVWFLAQTTSGPGERTCSVPPGRTLILLPATNECSKAENPTLTTESALGDCAITGNAVNSLMASVDGVQLKNLEKYRVQSPAFTINLPKENNAGVSAGPTEAVANAYIIFLKPLSPGNHTVKSSQVTLEDPTTNTQNFQYSIVYHLNVK